MSNSYPDLLIQCDTREQSALLKNHNMESAIVKGKYLISDYSESELYRLSQQRPRITSIYNYFSKKGCEVAIGKLDRCDYWVTGYHRDKEVNLGVEYKALTDFVGSNSDLPWKLWESCDKYHDVALFIEGKVDVSERDEFYFVRNWGADIDTLRYDLYQSRLATWQEQGVNVRQFDKLDQFAPSLDGVIDYVTKNGHRSFEYREPCNADLILKMISQVPGIKVYTINKLLKGNPSMSFAELNQMSIEELQERIGEKTGEKLWGILHAKLV